MQAALLRYLACSAADAVVGHFGLLPGFPTNHVDCTPARGLPVLDGTMPPCLTWTGLRYAVILCMALLLPALQFNVIDGIYLRLW